jgi:hypothetical protein
MWTLVASNAESLTGESVGVFLIARDRPDVCGLSHRLAVIIIRSP